MSQQGIYVGYCVIVQSFLDVMAHWLRRLLSTGGSWVRLPLWPPRRDLGQVLYLPLPVCFGVKLRYGIRAVLNRIKILEACFKNKLVDLSKINLRREISNDL